MGIKLAFFLLDALLVGAPIGTILYLRAQKNRCIARLDGGDRCPGLKSRACVDGLCPTCCDKLHKDSCREKAL